MQSLCLSMLALIMLAACAAQTAAQAASASCVLKQAPELHGFRLGMTSVEVKKSLADASMFDSKISSGNGVGSRAVNINASELKAEVSEAVESIYLTFVDERVALVKVTYNSASQWDGSEDFFKRESASLGLPLPSGPDSFQGSGGNEKYIVACGEFTATLAYSFGVSPSVAVSDMTAQKKVDKRRDKEETGVRETRTGLRRRRTGPAPLPPQTGEPGQRPFMYENR